MIRRASKVPAQSIPAEALKSTWNATFDEDLVQTAKKSSTLAETAEAFITHHTTTLRGVQEH